MDMNGVTRIFGGNTPQSAGRAAVQAIKAGTDYVLIPGDLDGAYNGVLEAARSGEIPESRIDQSVLKILRAKAALGLHKNRLVDLNAVNDIVSRPENVALAQQIADDAVTVVRDSQKLLPLPPGVDIAPKFAYHAATPPEIISWCWSSPTMRAAKTDALWCAKSATVCPTRVSSTWTIHLPPRSLRTFFEAVAAAKRVIAAVYVIPSAGRVVAGDPGSPALDRGPSTVLANVLKSANDKTVVVALGNPYVILEYPAIRNYICTFSNAPVSEQSAVKFLFGEIPARGHLPVTIPGIANREPMPATTSTEPSAQPPRAAPLDP